MIANSNLVPGEASHYAIISLILLALSYEGIRRGQQKGQQFFLRVTFCFTFQAEIALARAALSEIALARAALSIVP